MKKRILALFFGLLSAAGASGQWINTVWLSPANPTPQDTIIFYADLSFPYGSCDQHSKLVQVAGNTVDAYTIHCLGALTFICGHTDTFKVAPLPTGNYTFRIHVDHGILPAPCTPGIVAGPTDSIDFTVTPVTDIEVRFPESGILVYPTPASDKLFVRNDYRKPVELEIYSITGTRVIARQITGGKDEIDIHALPLGFYYIKVIAEGVRVETKRIAVMR
jgi:hypothetical protein